MHRIVTKTILPSTTTSTSTTTTSLYSFYTMLHQQLFQNNAQQHIHRILSQKQLQNNKQHQLQLQQKHSKNNINQFKS